jgi:hypothetical protein
MNEKAPSAIDLNRIFNMREKEGELVIEPIRLFRGSEDYEKLRLKTDNQAVQIL